MAFVPGALRSPTERRASVVVVVVMAVFVIGVYVAVVLGGGVLTGHTDAPQLGLSILATAIVAIGFEPVQTRVESWARRRLLHGRPSPYEVLSRFGDDVSQPQADDELPDRMAKVLAQGTGASWAQVWLVVHDQPVLAGTWPPDEPGSELGLDRGDPAATQQREVVLGEDVLGILRIHAQADRPLGPVELRLLDGLAAQAGVQLRAAGLRAELADRLAELSLRAEELTRSRQRLIDVQDQGRRRLERDIHDGAQQHLVALAVNLRLAQTLAAKSPDRAATVLAEQVEATQTAIDALVDLSRGIYPTALVEHGLVAALEAAAVASAVPVRVTANVSRRYRHDVEEAVYFCCLEAMQNAAKHSGAPEILVELDWDGQRLTWTVRDHGCGIEGSQPGEGLANMRDRMDAVGGGLAWESDPGGGTVARGWLVASDVGAVQ